MTHKKWYTQDFFADLQKLLERAPTSKDAALPSPAKGLRTLANTPGISWISPATTAILATRASSESTRLEKTRLFIWPQRKKSRQERSGERAGQFTGPPCPIHCPEYAISDAFRTFVMKCAGAASC
ncbi:hypothetical protein TNCV_3795091 [Trichonephila clavipes]|nr:hypothetical protein TNCV_3795091 [Trichonephila clavipes]